MFTTINNVKEYTNADVTLDLIKRAQAIIEVFVGKDEVDVENPSDLLILDKMTAYQAAYMLNNEDIVYTQMASPFVAPLAVFAAKGLSFKKPRSIRTGRIFQLPRVIDWRRI
jgi:hypothetical protein